jgi:hypothetical protein
MDECVWKVDDTGIGPLGNPIVPVRSALKAKHSNPSSETLRSTTQAPKLSKPIIFLSKLDLDCERLG